MRTLIGSLLALGLLGGCHRDAEIKVVEVEKKPVVPPAEPVQRNAELNVKGVSLEDERSSLSRSVEERTNQLDAKIDALEKRGDDKAKEAAATLRAKRDQARGKMTEIGSRTQENWQAFKVDVSDAWDSLERDVNEATR